ncbi:MAG: CARDB domain-containing protein [Thermoleophilia bacterium]
MRRILILLGLLLLSAAAAGEDRATAFDSGTHFDVTRDALTSEGFGNTSVETVQVSNWFVDLYENFESVPFSGHAGFFKEIIGGATPLARLFTWPDDVVAAADRSHFDQTGGGFRNTAEITAEWDRLRRSVGAMAIEARDRDDPLELLSVIGISLHQVQDFYSHTNWLEPGAVPGGRGPDWAGKGFGATPTWFDIPAAVREGEVLATAGATGNPRDHGSWKADGNTSLQFSDAKDWPGRPLYTEAHVAAYFASRQWVRAIRAQVNDEAFWGRAMRLARRPPLLAKDQHGALNISVASGHWQGQGEPCNPSLTTFTCGARSGPGGSLIDLRGAVKYYFEPQGVLSEMRHRFQDDVVRVHGDSPATPFPVASSRDIQAQTRFVRFEVTSMAEVDNLDIPGDADLFARASIAGQRYISGVINSRDSFSFRKPNAPFTWLRAVARTATAPTPITSILVRIRTGDVRFAGTDDDVFLRVGATRYPLDKRIYDDFERGDDDTYSVPIDDDLGALDFSDVTTLAIEKGRDGAAGGWRLGAASVSINGVRVAHEPKIDRWLEDDHRTHRLRFRLPAPTGGAALPVSLALWEMDAPLRGGNDHTDIHPWDRRRDIGLSYVPGSGDRTGGERGGDRFSGRLGDSDTAKLTWRLSTYDPVLQTVRFPSPEAAPPPPPPPLPPNLRITQLDLTGFTVANVGAGPAGPFLVSLSSGGGSRSIAGLAAGQSLRVDVPRSCFGLGEYKATADSLNQVAESDETDNVTALGPVIC